MTREAASCVSFLLAEAESRGLTMDQLFDAIQREQKAYSDGWDEGQEWMKTLAGEDSSGGPEAAKGRALGPSDAPTTNLVEPSSSPVADDASSERELPHTFDPAGHLKKLDRGQREAIRRRKASLGIRPGDDVSHAESAVVGKARPIDENSQEYRVGFLDGAAYARKTDSWCGEASPHEGHSWAAQLGEPEAASRTCETRWCPGVEPAPSAETPSPEVWNEALRLLAEMWSIRSIGRTAEQVGAFLNTHGPKRQAVSNVDGGANDD